MPLKVLKQKKIWYKWIYIQNRNTDIENRLWETINDGEIVEKREPSSTHQLVGMQTDITMMENRMVIP